MAPLELIDHPYRRAIMDEVHARPIEIIDAAMRVRRLVFVMPPNAEALGAVFALFVRFCHEIGVSAPEPGSRQHSFELPSKAVTWEFHSEFVTLTWRSSLADGNNQPEDIGLSILGEAQLIAAMRIDVLDEPSVPDRLLPGFALSSLCVSAVETGLGQVVTDFVADADRFTRFEFAAGRLTPLRRSIVVRRLLEVETYRNMALLGLPLARSVSPSLRALEIELTGLVQTLSAATTAEAVQTALSALHDLSVRSGQLSEVLGYRFAASHAYGDILRTRLAGLHEQPTPIGSSLAAYVGNRVEPALATCAALEKRLSVLSDKIERAIGLLNVRIGLDMQIQNRALLDNIAQTATSQFRLQRTVEGLSAIAISYYFLGILSYFLAGPLETMHWEKTMALSIAAPIVVLVVWLMARAVRNRH